MHVAITGGTGMIGTALSRALVARGDRVTILTRSRDGRRGQVRWDPTRGISSMRLVEGVDAVVNLTGAPLATRPWTRPRRRVLLESRVEATRVIVSSFARLDAPPPVFIGMGHLGRFGDRGHAWLDDDDDPGTGFLAELANAWEEAHHLAYTELGSRVAVLRLGICMSSRGGIVPPMVSTFQHGLGGWLGSGRQYTPWTSERDAVAALLHLLDDDGAVGGFNGSVPDPVPNRQWCEAVGHVLDTQIMTHAPDWALRGAWGELADAIFLASLRARPRKLTERGFRFTDTDAESTFRRLVQAIHASGSGADSAGTG